MPDEIRRQMIYLVSVDVLRRMLKCHNYDKKMLDRVNKKNAETMGCMVVEL